MQFLLFLVAIGIVVYGVITSSLPWVMAGTLAIGLLSSGRLGTATAEDAKRFNQFVKTVLGPPWQQLLLAALLCTGIAGWTFHQDHFAITSVYFWLAALFLMLGAGFLHDRTVLVVSSTIPGPSSSVANDAQGKWTLFDWSVAACLTLLALGLRLYQLGEYLPPVHGDEGEMGMLALLALHGPASGVATQRLPLFTTAFLDHPTLFHYVQAFGMLLFGETITALRITSAIFGALCAPFLYAIGRAGRGRIAGLTAGWLIAVSHLHIHYSRMALNNIETVFFIILLIWLLALVHESNQPPTHRSDVDTYHPWHRRPLLLFIVIGLVIGLGQYFYYGSRLIPALAAPLLFSLWRQQRLTIQQVAVLIAATVVAYFPLGLFYAHDLPAFLNRTQVVHIFTPKNLTHTLGPQASWPHDIPALLWHQVKANLYFFLHYGDKSAFYLHTIPAFDKVTVILFWLGLGAVLAKVRRYHELALVAWLSLGVFFAGVVTIDSPNGPRLIVAVPAVYLIGGVFIQNMHHLFAKVWPASSRWVGTLPVGTIAAITLYLNFNTYFVVYKQLQPNLERVYIAQEIADTAKEYRSYLLGAPNLYVNHGTIRFIAVAAEKYDLEKPDQLMALLAEQPTDKGALLIALPHHVTDLEQIEKQFPNGTKNARKDARGNLLYVTYQIPAVEVTKQLAR
jgi:4-amino-4-deoxy-L-arabinose transferase-like glycosyltransferase